MGQQKRVFKRALLVLFSLLAYTAGSKLALATYECVPGSLGYEEGCPPQFSDLQGVVLRVVTVLITLLGLLLLGLIIQSAIAILMSRDNEEAKAKAFSKLRSVLLGFVGIMMSYTLIVFVARWLGVVDHELSLVQSGRLVFDYMLPN